MPNEIVATTVGCELCGEFSVTSTSPKDIFIALATHFVLKHPNVEKTYPEDAMGRDVFMALKDFLTEKKFGVDKKAVKDMSSGDDE